VYEKLFMQTTVRTSTVLALEDSVDNFEVNLIMEFKPDEKDITFFFFETFLLPTINQQF
jgi:hypothetical protein